MKNLNGQQRIKLLIFDLGNTVFHIRFENIFEYWAKACGKEADWVQEKMSYDGAYEAYERGAVNSQEFLADINKRLDSELTFAQFEEGWNSLFLSYLEGMPQWLESLKKDFFIAALSNTNHSHLQFFKHYYPGLEDHFDRCFYSHQIGAVKPDPVAYLSVLHHYEIAASEAVFFDDKPENIAGALRLGIHSHQMIDIPAAQGFLARLLDNKRIV